MGERSREYIYGLNPAFEVLRAGRRKVLQAFLSESSRNNPRLARLEDQLRDRAVPVQWVDKNRVLQLSESRENQGVVLRTTPYPYTPLDAMLGRDRLLLLDNVEDPHNAGAILRSAEIFGFRNVLLPMRGSPEVYPSLVKVSAGATEFMDIARESSANQYFKAAQAAGYETVALDMGGACSLRELRGRRFAKLLLVIGGEAAAVGQYILNSADLVVRIDQRGRVNSLNASVAAGIAMYELAGATDAPAPPAGG